MLWNGKIAKTATFSHIHDPRSDKLATKDFSSALRFCFAQKITVDQVLKLLYLSTPAVLGNFLIFFPLLLHFHHKFNNFMHQTVAKTVAILCADSLRD